MHELLGIFLGATRNREEAEKLAASFERMYGEASVANALELRDRQFNRTSREGQLSSAADVAAAELIRQGRTGMQKQLYVEIDELSQASGMSIPEATELVIRSYGGDPTRVLSAGNMRTLGTMDADHQREQMGGPGPQALQKMARDVMDALTSGSNRLISALQQGGNGGPLFIRDRLIGEYLPQLSPTAARKARELYQGSRTAKRLDRRYSDRLYNIDRKVWSLPFLDGDSGARTGRYNGSKPSVYETMEKVIMSQARRAEVVLEREINGRTGFVFEEEYTGFHPGRYEPTQEYNLLRNYLRKRSGFTSDGFGEASAMAEAAQNTKTGAALDGMEIVSLAYAAMNADRILTEDIARNLDHALESAIQEIDRRKQVLVKEYQAEMKWIHQNHDRDVRGQYWSAADVTYLDKLRQLESFRGEYSNGREELSAMHFERHSGHDWTGYGPMSQQKLAILSVMERVYPANARRDIINAASNEMYSAGIVDDNLKFDLIMDSLQYPMKNLPFRNPGGAVLQKGANALLDLVQQDSSRLWYQNYVTDRFYHRDQLYRPLRQQVEAIDPFWPCEYDDYVIGGLTQRGQ